MISEKLNNLLIIILSILFLTIIFLPTLAISPLLKYLIINFSKLWILTPFLIYLILLIYSLAFLLESFIILKVVYNPEEKEGSYKLNELKPGVIYYALNEVLMRMNEKLFSTLLIPKNVYAEILFQIFGLKKGKNMHLNPVKDPYLVEIGNDVIIGQDVFLLGHELVNESIRLKRIRIGDNVTIGGRSIISPGVIIEDNVVIGANSFVRKDIRLEEGYFYAGCPVKKIKKLK